MSLRNSVPFLVAAALFVAVATARAETVLVSEGSAMTYRANSTNPGISGVAWTAEGYAPSGWSSGSYGVGYETDVPPNATALLATTVTPAPGTYSIYTRATFSIPDVSAVQNLILGADYDDGWIAWINGVEVYRSPEMPLTTPAWNTNTLASHESSNGTDPNYGSLVDVSAAGIPAIHNGTNVLAVGVWNRAAASSTDLVLVPRLVRDATGAVSRGPYLQTGTPNSVVVRWRTNLTGDSCVRYGVAPGSLTLTKCAVGSTSEHVVEVTGLSPDTLYYYSVGTSAGALVGDDADHRFRTSPATGVAKPTRVWVLGDSGTADTNAADVRDGYLAFTGATATDLWLMLGDNAYNDGTDSEFQAAVFDMYPTVLRQSVLWPTLGNHDGVSADSASGTGPYYDMFTLPEAAEAGGFASGTEAYYSFDYGDIHFVCLESYETSRSVGGAMLTWLDADLADTTAEWVVVFFHHPPYSKGSHNSDTESELVQMRQNALPILEDRGVDLVLTGHSHSYERSFLLDGHYGTSGTLVPSMKVDGGDGREDGDGAYTKPAGGPAPNAGAVYVVAGSSGQVDSGALNHPAMAVSLAELGSLVLDFDGSHLDVQFLDTGGMALDWFTIEKPPAAPVCGDGVPEGTEECDDGNAANTDACVAGCLGATCGDTFVYAGVEDCDDGDADNTDACLNTCETASCGDGFVRAGVEQCDDGDLDDTDACPTTCETASCGDGFVRSGVEDCDDADADNTDACLDTCEAASCGDAFVHVGIEQCDDGDLDNTDGCLTTCELTSCGDGFVQVGVEECDDADADDTDACLSTCQHAFCGDGFVRAGLEDCDDADQDNTDACLDTCEVAACGDGFVRAGVEECDDADADNTDACLDSCEAASCGDGFVRSGVEDCDDGDADDTDACLTTCEVASCGDGFVRVGVEGCDDGDIDNTDSCLDTCEAAVCGDGFVRTGVELCDDGDADDTDACLTTCVNASCGDGFVQAGVEGCDDGDLDTTDACTNECALAACGDGSLHAGFEDCDDGNVTGGDGCGAACTVDCPVSPRDDCREAGLSVLRLVDRGDATARLVKWKWRKGPAVGTADIGDPSLGDGYNVCFYRDVPGAGSLGGGAWLEPGPLWTPDGRGGFRYTDATGSAGGVQDLRLSTGEAGRSRLLLKGRGANVPSGLLPAASYTVQAIGAASGSCWTSAFATGRSTPTSFRGKALAP